jgi:hypothetical protein
MTANEREGGRQAERLREAAPAEKNATCGVCGQKLGGGPKLLYMPEVNGKLVEVRVCPFCFLKIVMEAKA